MRHKLSYASFEIDPKTGDIYIINPAYKVIIKPSKFYVIEHGKDKPKMIDKTNAK